MQLNIIKKTHNDIANNLDSYVKMIYNNFKKLENYDELKHNKHEILNLLTSHKSIFYFVICENKIIGYLIGQILKLNDNRNVFYISYLFILPKFRRHGIAQKLLDIVKIDSINKNLNGIMLIADSENEKIYDFYLKNNFNPDYALRRYAKHEVLYKFL